MSISFQEGTDYPIVLTADDIEGNPLNLSGATVVAFKVYRRPREASAAVLVKGLTAGVTLISDPDNNKIGVAIVAGDLFEGEYSFDCYATLSDASIAPVGRGEIDVTHFDSLEV